MVLGKVYRLSVRKEEGKASFLLEHRNRSDECLLFETGAVASLTPAEVDSIRSFYKHQIDGYGCLGVLEIACSGDLNLYFLVIITGCVSIGKIGDSEIFRITDTGFISLRGWPQDGERILEIRRVMNAGTFYFSWSAKTEKPLDITLCAQRRARTQETDNRFFWNKTLHRHFKRFGIDCDKWLLKAMCGGISISTVYVGSKQAKACLFSRLSCERAGTRFNVRGVDDNGHVANFVETEQVIFLEDAVSSYLMIRGSVPLFWEQPGVNVGSHKIKMSRGSEISQPSFDRHVSLVKKRYGRQHFITLCGSKEGEANLTRMYMIHHKASLITKDIPLTAFDYHHYCSRGRTENLRKLKDQIEKSLSQQGFFTRDSRGNILTQQTGTFRVNCVDCLDRTNSVQSFIGLEILEKQLQSLSLADKATTVSKFVDTYKNMWIMNGDYCSRIYAGTGALEGKSKLKDSTLSVARTIQNNLLDSSKQEAMDILLLGKSLDSASYADRARSLLPSKFFHLQPNILKSLCDQHLDFTSPTNIKVTVGTWNVNGGKHFNSIVYKRSDPLSDWLLDHRKSNNTPNIMDMSHNDSLGEISDDPSDIYAIGFEEIVDLNASNIMSASTSNQREWLTELQKTISRDTRYVLISSVQLVGVCLFLFVRPCHARHIRDVAVDQVKTGLGGATGNKGGVTIRFRLHSSTLAFVCAHFAAGQHQVSDRNADYMEITRKTSFPLSRDLPSHDYVFWCGDFNYRIDLDNEYVKDLVDQQDWKTLLAADQLTIQRNDGKVFQGFIEADITFPPTYKYDINSDDYDTSEKNRIPAYTDRVLFMKNFSTNNREDPTKYPGTILFYGRAELKTSDHRPVVAVIQIEVLHVDEHKRDEVLRDTLETQGPPDGTVYVTDCEGGRDLLSAELVSQLLETMEREAGEIILARFGDDSFNVIFKEGRSALRALKFDGKAFVGERISVRLKTPNWVDIIMDELINFRDTTIPLCDEIIDENEDDINYDAPLGPEVDAKFLIVGDDDGSDSLSGRNSPSVVSQDGSTDGESKKPSRPPLPAVVAAPKRPPPPSSIVSAPSDVVKPVPMRAAPPPPVKVPLQKQETLIPPSITKTCPSTDSEHSFERGPSFEATPSVDPFDSEPDTPLSAKEQPDPVQLINDAWNDETPVVPSSNATAKPQNNSASRGPPPNLPPVPPPPISDDEVDSKGPPPSMAPPPPPVPTTGPPSRPPPIPQRSRGVPSIPPRS